MMVKTSAAALPLIVLVTLALYYQTSAAVAPPVRGRHGFEALPLDAAGPQTVCFRTVEKQSGLPWPLTNGRDLQQLIGHGQHCLETTIKFAVQPPLNEVDRMHFAHCAFLLEQATEFVQATRYTVPDAICQDVGDNLVGRGRIDDGVSVRTILGAAAYYAYVTYNYGQDDTTDRVSQGMYAFLVRESSSQYELFGRLNGQNLGNLLMREFHNASDLTAAEYDYLSDWHNEREVRLASLGLYCAQGGKDGMTRIKAYLALHLTAQARADMDRLRPLHRGGHHQHADTTTTTTATTTAVSVADDDMVIDGHPIADNVKSFVMDALILSLARDNLATLQASGGGCCCMILGQCTCMSSDCSRFCPCGPIA